MRFPNRAGDHADTDDILRAELSAAGIPTLQESAGKPPECFAEMLRESSGEVKTSVMGVLHGWQFKRAWYYWMCEGPGIEVAAAERLHAAHSETVRVAGHCGCPNPREWFKGLAVGHYHVDDAEGLKALADTIRDLVAAPAPQPVSTSWTPVGTRLPEPGVTVLACYVNRAGQMRRVRAQWIAAKTIESGCDSEIGEYDEEADTFYDPEGWYERIDNWGDYTAVAVCEGDVTHWMPLPACPTQVVPASTGGSHD